MIYGFLLGLLVAFPAAYLCAWRVVATRLRPFAVDLGLSCLIGFGYKFHFSFFENLSTVLPLGEKFFVYDRQGGVVMIGRCAPPAKTVEP